MLLTKPPKNLNGVLIPTDCKTWMRFGHIWSSRLLPTEKIRLTFRLLLKIEPFEKGIDIERWMDEFLWFYRCGAELRDTHQSKERLLDWEKDSASIWADFRMYAGIDLDKDPIHWWEFMALFESLPEDASIKQRISIRSVDLSKIKDSETRRHYAEMKTLVALDSPDEDDWW